MKFITAILCAAILGVVIGLVLAGSRNLKRATECEAAGGEYSAGLFSGECTKGGAK